MKGKRKKGKRRRAEDKKGRRWAGRQGLWTGGKRRMKKSRTEADYEERREGTTESDADFLIKQMSNRQLDKQRRKLTCPNKNIQSGAGR